MSTFRKYPEIVRLDKRPEILAVKQVVATEKVHGTNFRVFFPAGMTSLDDVRCGGRNEEFAHGDDGFYGGRPVRWFRDRPALLGRLFEVFTSFGLTDVTVFGEASAPVSIRASATFRTTTSSSARSTSWSATTSSPTTSSGSSADRAGLVMR